MIYITGDTHGEHERFFPPYGESSFSHLTDNDVLIVAGDFGYLFYDTDRTNVFLDELESLPFQIAFVDGNHENFPMIYSCPVEEWCGGQTHRIRKNIHHLVRGEVFNIQERRILVFGGADSIDKERRRAYISWWPEEIPNHTEYENAIQNIEKYGSEIDYIITHTAPNFAIDMMGFQRIPNAPDAQLCGFLDWVASDSAAKNYKRWFFGHWHLDFADLALGIRRSLAYKHMMPLYYAVIPIDNRAE